MEMWECEWREMKKTNRELQRFIATEVRRLLDQVKVMSPERILSEVRNERLFGCVEVDIRVPDHLKEKFSEMCPIFKNTEISRDDIGDFMKACAEEHNIMAQPRRSLIESMNSPVLSPLSVTQRSALGERGSRNICLRMLVILASFLANRYCACTTR